MDRIAARGGRSLTICRKAASVLADGMPCTFCGCSSAGRARRFQRRGHEFEPRHPLHFGCVHALRGHAFMVLVARDVRDPRPESRAARHHIRRDARVWAQPKWIHAFVAQQAEQPPCKRQAARSNRRRGAPPAMSRSSSWPRTPGFQSGYAGSNPARDARTTRSPVELTLRGGNRPQRLGGAGTRDRMDFSGGVAQHPEEQPPCKRQAAGSNPVTSTTNQRLVNSVARVPACLVGSRGFDSRTRRQRSLPR